MPATEEEDWFLGKKFGKSNQVVVMELLPRLKGRNKKYKVHCSECAKDQLLHGDGFYDASVGLLNSGGLPCGCSPIPKWSERQHIVRLERVCSEKNYTYTGYDGDWRGAHTKVNLLCNEDQHVWKATINNILRGSGCSKCSVSGYSSKIAGYVYVLIASNGTSRFTGFGITNYPEQRLKTHNRHLAKAGYVVEECELFETSGESAQIAEKGIIQNFTITPQNVEGFKREATYWYNYEEVLDFIENEIEALEHGTSPILLQGLT